MLDLVKSVEDKLNKLSQELSDPKVISDNRLFTKLSREHQDLTEVVSVGQKYRKLLTTIEEARKIIADANDPELIPLAEQELQQAEIELEPIEIKLKLLLLPRDPNDAKNVIVEIRAGTGGEEAGLFVADLFRMYSRYADTRGFKIDLLTSNPTGVGGLKEVIFSVTGENVFSDLKYESGVHRVQRVPATEASGRIHTSAASVAVLPEADEVDIAISPEDLRIDVFRSSGPGGQSVNTTDSAVRITHIPTGTVVSCQDEKSQLKNKNKAMKVLRARLLDHAVAEQQAKIASARKTMVGSGDRSEKIRTYNFPQNRVTDHRINLTLYKLTDILAGDLNEFIAALHSKDQEERLKKAGELAEVN
ncbi:MAG: peptide chain release factor 1 [Candidatus Zixiibacteriota bacterium]|nr:MAG: peptide chain release factor 1 [candidate division Zixibacteria bacterium]